MALFRATRHTVNNPTEEQTIYISAPTRTAAYYYVTTDEQTDNDYVVTCAYVYATAAEEIYDANIFVDAAGKE